MIDRYKRSCRDCENFGTRMCPNSYFCFDRPEKPYFILKTSIYMRQLKLRKAFDQFTDLIFWLMICATVVAFIIVVLIGAEAFVQHFLANQ